MAATNVHVFFLNLPYLSSGSLSFEVLQIHLDDLWQKTFSTVPNSIGKKNKHLLHFGVEEADL